jgi:hypothetical protein
MMGPASLVSPILPRVGVEVKELVAGFRIWSAGNEVLPVKAIDAWNREKGEMSEIGDGLHDSSLSSSLAS